MGIKTNHGTSTEKFMLTARNELMNLITIYVSPVTPEWKCRKNNSDRPSVRPSNKNSSHFTPLSFRWSLTSTLCIRQKAFFSLISTNRNDFIWYKLSENASKILVGKPEGKRPLERPRHRWEGDIIMHIGL